MRDDVLICRCEEVTVGDIRKAIAEGARTVDGIKRVTRAGKGLCQGRTCRGLVERILCEELQKGPESLGYPSVRPPVRPMSIETFLGLDAETEGSHE